MLVFCPKPVRAKACDLRHETSVRLQETLRL